MLLVRNALLRNGKLSFRRHHYASCVASSVRFPLFDDDDLPRIP